MNRALPPGDHGQLNPNPRRPPGSVGVVLGGLVDGVAAIARKSRVGHCRATLGPRWHVWRRLGVTAKAAVTGARRAGIQSTSRKARRGRNRAGRQNLRAMLLAEGVPALPVRALGGRDRDRKSVV